MLGLLVVKVRPAARTEATSNSSADAAEGDRDAGADPEGPSVLLEE